MTKSFIRSLSASLQALTQARSFSSQSAAKNILPTIGIVGFNPMIVAYLNEQIVKYGNEKKELKNDQNFPNMITIGVNDPGDKRILDSQVKLCYDYGADIIVAPHKVGDSRIDDMIYDSTRVKVMFLRDHVKNLAKEVVDKALEMEVSRRPSLVFKNTHGSENDQPEILQNIKSDETQRNQRMMQRQKVESYSVLMGRKFVGVVGGAGPLASAAFCQKLAEQGLNYIHVSDNSAPGKHLFEMGVGPSYLDHYSSDVRFLNKVGVSALAVTCNTAHKRLKEFCDEKSIKKIVDIRSSVLTQNSSVDGFILLGTNRTVGVGLPAGEVNGIYEEFRATNFPDSKPFIVPSEEQQKIIMEAIFDVKAGELAKAKSKINGVIAEIREKINNHNIPVIFGCTELPLPYEKAELVAGNIIDPADSMARAAKELINRGTRRKTPSVILNIDKKKFSTLASKPHDPELPLVYEPKNEEFSVLMDDVKMEMAKPEKDKPSSILFGNRVVSNLSIFTQGPKRRD